MTSSLNAEQVADFLLSNPGFFEEHAELLAGIRLSSPVLGRAVSLQERQMEVLREKLRNMELSTSHLVHTAQVNEIIATKLYAWIYAMLQTSSSPDRPQLLIDKLKTIFTIPQATLRLWHTDANYREQWFTEPVSDDIRHFVHSLKGPYCGSSQDVPVTSLLNDATVIRSVAVLPIMRPASDDIVGVLVLGAEDPERFTIEMATDFLEHISDTTTAALSFLMPKHVELTLA